ncbi:transcriptional regulator family: Fungal Specific TF [Penicillium atrosanguineum]|uniref:transcriptional regulator family: Fungal Specific TF n=1 Tax=Penicillium atrosanguineum TaxID=1132637 RepID=UPI0023A2BE6D|nr:transcriptional regulator family: Fungal Specific TF [Penicillium atrosanguineum]KAJ5301198.1 transcriptional regulator family: Fungal Specific TF [Penicillium atrosanguineum]
MSGVASALAGLDMTMPGDIAFDSATSYWGTNLTLAVLNDTVPRWRVDEMAIRIMAVWYYVGAGDSYVPINFASWTLETYGYEYFYANEGYTVINEHVDVRNGHGALIREIGAASAVLLKNEGALPLTGKEKLTTVFGSDAGASAYGPNGCSDRGCDMGTLGWDGSFQGIYDDYAYSEAEALAAQASVAIVFVNADSGEGYINTVSSECNNTIVIIHSVGPVLMDSFVGNPNVTGIIWAGVPGEESGISIADVLYGRVKPGGKLPFTVGYSRENYGTDILYVPNSGESAPQVDFSEGQFIDYRAFDKGDITPLYEFGYGLSYTKFSYSELKITKHNAGKYMATTGKTSAAPILGTTLNDTSDYLFPDYIKRVPYFIYPYLNSTSLEKSADDPNYGTSANIPAGAQDGSSQLRLPASGEPGGNPALWDVLYTVTATVTNTGKVAGDEVAQLYVGLGGPNDASVQLRSFDRLSIQPGQSVTFTVDLTRRELSNRDTVTQNWLISDYVKTVHVGASSRKVPLKQTIAGAEAFPSDSLFQLEVTYFT